jgi:hypothetical protein
MGGSIEEVGTDHERYLGWFAWAQAALDRDLDASHAAAEAGYEAEAGGATRSVAEVAARGAGTEPVALDPASIALAEWAYWAQTRFGTSAADGLRAARQGLAVLDSSHNLDTAIASVETDMAARRSSSQPVVAPSIIAPSPTPSPAPSPPLQVAVPLWRRTWVIVAGAIFVTAVFTAAITAGIMSSSSSNSNLNSPGKPLTPPAMVVAQTAGGIANITVTGFPPDTNVYVLVDNVVVESIRTDTSGSAQTSVPLAYGGHQISACLDFQGVSCPATDFETRNP